MGQSSDCEGSSITYTDSLLIGGEFTEDMFSVGWADPNLREGCKFLRHLIQQSPHLQKKTPQPGDHVNWDPVWRISPAPTGSSSPLCSCVQSGAVGDTAPVWCGAWPRTHRKPFQSRPAETAVWQRSRAGEEESKRQQWRWSGKKRNGQLNREQKKAVGVEWIKYKMQYRCWLMHLDIFSVFVCVCACCVELMPVDKQITAVSAAQSTGWPQSSVHKTQVSRLYSYPVCTTDVYST